MGGKKGMIIWKEGDKHPLANYTNNQNIISGKNTEWSKSVANEVNTSLDSVGLNYPIHHVSNEKIICEKFGKDMQFLSTAAVRYFHLIFAYLSKSISYIATSNTGFVGNSIPDKFLVSSI